MENGGAIFNNAAGTISVDDETLNNGLHIFGGDICDNYASNSGGAIYNENDSLFEMYGGAINNNRVTSEDNSQIFGGALFNRGTFNMYGGEYCDNNASCGGSSFIY